MKIITVAALALGLLAAPAAAIAQERIGDGVLGAVAGGLVGGPVGAVAGGAIGYGAGPHIARGLRGDRYRYRRGYYRGGYGHRRYHRY